MIKFCLKRELIRERQLQDAVQMQEKIRAEEAEIAGKVREIKTRKEEIKGHTARIKLLQSKHQYMDGKEIKKLRKHLQEVGRFAASLPTSPDDDLKQQLKRELGNLCPICVQIPGQIFCCAECDDWICGDCRGYVRSCRNCQEDFVVRPPKRNRMAERLVEKLTKVSGVLVKLSN